MDSVLNWLSNKLNLHIIVLLCYSMILYMLWDKLTTNQLIFISIIILLLCLLHRILGVAKGMMLYSLNKEQLDYIEKKIRKETNENKA